MMGYKAALWLVLLGCLVVRSGSMGWGIHVLAVLGAAMVYFDRAAWVYRGWDGRRVVGKVIGVAAVWLVWWVYLWLFADRVSGWIGPGAEAIRAIWWPLTGGVLAWVVVADGWAIPGGDGWAYLWRRGSLQVWAAQLVRLFFLPMMASFLWHTGSALGRVGSVNDWPGFVGACVSWLFWIDCGIGFVAYVLSSGAFSGAIRSVDVSGWGVVSCLSCYGIFYDFVFARLLPYGSGVQWSAWLGQGPMAWLWGMAVLASLLVYVWGTVSLGPHFGNLVDKGTVTTGAYRWFRHPSYVGKGFFWFLTMLPFLGPDKLLHMMSFAGVCAIYWVRAVTEELHLSTREDYRAYRAALAARIPSRPRGTVDQRPEPQPVL